MIRRGLVAVFVVMTGVMFAVTAAYEPKVALPVIAAWLVSGILAAAA